MSDATLVPRSSQAPRTSARLKFLITVALFLALAVALEAPGAGATGSSEAAGEETAR